MNEHDPGTIDLVRLGDEALDAAHRNAAGRSARPLLRGAGLPLTQTLLALVAGQALDEHASPEAATLHVLRGRVELHAGEQRYPLSAGQWRAIPPMRHSLAAHEDAVVLLSVAIAKPAAIVTE